MSEDRLVLVADDEPALRETAAFILESEGYRVVLASNGEEALAVARREGPRAALIDVNMPKKNGFELCRALRKDPALAGMYVILLTARGQKTDEAEGLAAGADAYLTKPFDDEEILARLAKAFGG